MDARDRIIEAARELVEAQGYHATGLSQIIERSGAPRGSLYYYFPDGKDGLMEAVITSVGATIAERIADALAGVSDPAEAIHQLILTIARHAIASGFRAGGPITTIALETATTNERLNLACRAVYDRWQEVFAGKLLTSGYPAERAGVLAGVILASIEGAIILARARHDATPLEQVANELRSLVRLTAGSGKMTGVEQS